MANADRPRRLDDGALDLLFHAGRSHRAWKDTPVPEETLREVYDLAKLGPTSVNSSPARFVFLTNEGAKGRIYPALAATNVEKARAAPVVVIIAQDMEFHEFLPTLSPQFDARPMFVGNEALIAETALRNSSLQGAYFMLAARALGLDCGPVSGFDAWKVDAEFFPDGRWRSNFLCNLGFGDAERLHPRAPRLGFDAACRIL